LGNSSQYKTQERAFYSIAGRTFSIPPIEASAELQAEVLGGHFSGLKSNNARERNLAKCLRVFLGDEGRFSARDWKNGA
jgi:hypothetical protein